MLHSLFQYGLLFLAVMGSKWSGNVSSIHTGICLPEYHKQKLKIVMKCT